VSDINPHQVSLVVQSRQEATSEARVQASIYMAFSKGDKLEHVIQKATELGAYEIVAFPSARCVSRPDEKSLTKKVERWQKIAASAAEQSGRGRIPQVIVLDSYKSALERATMADLSILFYENERATTLRMALEENRFSSISLLTGPEGGLEEREVEQAKEMGLHICTLGNRILRCETAPLCALSAVMYASGEF
jgi:16S rRNA (uracil1498-N3)-methyltransferase